MGERELPNTGARFWAAQGHTDHAELKRTSHPAVPPAVVGAFESHSFDEGLRAGAQARLRREPITAYQRVGLDEFARGFRQGYFASRARGLQASESAHGAAASAEAPIHSSWKAGGA